METHEIPISMHEILHIEIGGKQKHEVHLQLDGREAMFNEHAQPDTIYQREVQVVSGRRYIMLEDGRVSLQIHELGGAIL